MEDHLGLKRNSKIQQAFGNSEKSLTDLARNRLDLPNRYKVEKPNLSYADFHHEITRNLEHISPKPSGNYLKRQIKAIEEEELVKYMSNLPSYLERGENRQEKVLSVGVLDWGRLEKWNCSQKQIPQGSTRHSLSSGDSSSYFSRERSSLSNGRGQTCYPGPQKMRRPSLQFHLMSSPIECHSQAIKIEVSGGNFQDVKASQIKAVNEQGKFIMKDQPFSRNHTEKSEIKLDRYKRHDGDINPKSRTLTNGLNYEARQCAKEKENTREDIQNGKFMKKAEKMQEMSCTVDKDISEKNDAIVVLRPKDFPSGNHSGVARLCESTASLGKKEEGASQKSISNMLEENFLPAVSSGVPHSCPLPYENDRQLEMQQLSKDAEGINCMRNSSHSAPDPAKMGINSLGNRISDIRETVADSGPSLKEPPTRMDLKPNKAATEKARSTSPFRRLSIGMGRISKSFSSKEVPPKLQSTHDSAKSGAENIIPSLDRGTCSNDTQKGTNRARSSPLRRLLDPVLKPKVPNCHHSGDSLQKGSMSVDRACKSSNGQLDCLTRTSQPGFIEVDATSSTAINATDSSKGKKHKTSASQALLRVAIKNGQPLFTFAVDNERDILAATMKELSTSRKDDYSCLYTFFAIQETEKKNGRWINHGGKGKGGDYIPNVVAQLKVTGSQFSNLSRQNYIEQSFAREFVLFSVDLREAEQQVLDFQPNNELAAILVKVAKVTYRTATGGGNPNDKCNDLGDSRFHSVLVDVQNGAVVGSQSLVSTTVILPSGVHSLPNKGGPSSLTQRWRSGGSCDCGGWDLGCKLRILTNQNQVSKQSSSSKACSLVDKFELISQGEDEEQPVFSLAPFKDGIYSVEFHSTLSIVQAFSLCIAILDGKKLGEVSESSNLFEGKTSRETILAQNDGMKAPNGNGEVTGRYFSYPPLSPVGRV